MNSKTSRFHELHQRGCFVIPNPWDRGSAILLEQLGFQALATTSSGFAWSTGRPDNGVSLAETLGHLRALLCERVKPSLSADEDSVRRQCHRAVHCRRAVHDAPSDSAVLRGKRYRLATRLDDVH